MRVEKVISQAEAEANGGGAVWKAGTYDFEVHDASEEISKASGNEQIKLTIWVFNTQGERKTVFDYLGAAAKVQWKVRQFCAGVGMIPQYESGELDIDEIVERTGRLKLGIQKSDQYGDQNKIMSYLEKEDQAPRAARPPTASRPAAAARQPARAAADLDDEIPF